MKKKSPYKFYYNVLRQALGQALSPNKHKVRSEDFVKAEYAKNYTRETNDDFMHKTYDVFINGTKALYPVIEYKKILLEMFARKLSSFAPKSLLELGSGRGFNILTLALLCPHIHTFRGIELTSEGVAMAKQNFANPPFEILTHLTGLSKEEITKRLSGRDIDFVEGSIRSLPFPSNSFDAVFSNSVIEQIPRDYQIVFSEAARVCRTVGVWSEPFFEAQNHHPFKLLYLRNIDYFRASYKEVEKAPWRIFQFETPAIQKYIFNTGFLTCTKNTNDQS
ncbi:MAG: hypothetical protein A2836_02545 [Candidatus Taylorbacteria bacterium RIFCSPHIGHO2_01_FULL_45_63]|uniref:Methyltransferase type 11 domain-containing protein n=1 Tax=Candidatus Taylorbacteria bacterium RIFCSPHIGHO2_02_FULL_45_35 TaxID=1802311 RepID=A0A1G2MRV1_9BACT|nr:MAG: hypothetical protein A2836_02545 [Candidatus Taylorbacteria bacterium RIFCSPHIGHO2_01_FULL_45_63]OHA26595.1 MAG: hypothetical protein A3D56_03140 [Candidatus Taylorbacteria bacterium RIFCSPHIGHO2_02_FULL_45_35]OHA33289.1 MAG: hypothetical protein A3A22_01765 [Candidatus Taylorbacteria bacterium RIFCSPLOWO2_01_FULL_45_34b]